MSQSAETDERINASWPAYEAALKAANVTYERHLYPGTQHGFNNNTTPRFDACEGVVRSFTARRPPGRPLPSALGPAVPPMWK